MSKTQVKLTDDNVTYFRAKELKVGQKIVGKYVKQIEDKYGHPCFKLVLTDGTTGIINYTGQLAALFEKVAIGTDVEVIYQGKTVIESGKWAGEEAHIFELCMEDASDNDELPAYQRSIRVKDLGARL